MPQLSFPNCLRQTPAINAVIWYIQLNVSGNVKDVQATKYQGAEVVRQ